MTIKALNLLRRITRAVPLRRRTPKWRDFMFRSFYGALRPLKIPMPGVMEVLRYTQKARWGPGKVDVRTMHRRTRDEIEYLPRLRFLGEYEVPSHEDFPEAATPITTPYQYEFTLDTRTDSGFGDKFAEQTFKYRSDERLSEANAKLGFFQEFGHLFEAENVKWDTMQLVARRRAQEPPKKE